MQKIIFYYWKNSKIPKVPSSEERTLLSGGPSQLWTGREGTARAYRDSLGADPSVRDFTGQTADRLLEGGQAGGMVYGPNSTGLNKTWHMLAIDFQDSFFALAGEQA